MWAKCTSNRSTLYLLDKFSLKAQNTMQILISSHTWQSDQQWFSGSIQHKLANCAIANVLVL